MTARGLPVRVLAPDGFRSWTVTCLTVPPGKQGSEVNAAMKARGITISAGYGTLKDSTIRIGHMGEHTLPELERVLTALEEVLAA
jgi:aspartate aminotransferase-like enzyme